MGTQGPPKRAYDERLKTDLDRPLAMPLSAVGSQSEAACQKLSERGGADETKPAKRLLWLRRGTAETYEGRSGGVCSGLTVSLPTKAMGDEHSRKSRGYISTDAD